MTDTYRRRAGMDTWHCCSRCSHWPAAYYTEQVGMPSDGQICQECMARRALMDCDNRTSVVPDRECPDRRS